MNRKQRRAEKKQGRLVLQGASQDLQGVFTDALGYHKAGRLNDAERLYRQILQVDARHADAMHLLGVLAHQVGRNNIAADMIVKAIAQDGQAPAFHNNLGNVLQAQGKLDEAVASYGRALTLKPDYAEAHNNLGNVLQAQGELDEAVASYGRALTLKPDYTEAHSNLGNVLQAQGKLDEAVVSYGRALILKPDDAESHSNLGNVLQAQGKLDEAVVSYGRALTLKPDYAEAHNNFGNVLQAQGKLDEAVVSYGRALTLKPDYAEAHSNLLMTLHYMADVSNAGLLEAARGFGKIFDKPTAATVLPNDLTCDRRLRIGYVSGDFRYHPVAYFFSRVLPAHDRDSVEVFCYTNSASVDAMTDRLRGASDHWHSIVGMSDADAASLIRRDGVDILIDLSGHTANNRLLLFTLRPAAVQASWLGYFGTTGLAAMDYLLMDATSVPPGEERWYSEAVVRLPYGRFCYEAPEMAPAPVDSPSLQRRQVTFGSFNNVAKIGPDVVRLWANVLRATPGSRLVLKWRSLDENSSRRRLSEAFAAVGIPADRLEFRGFSPHLEMLAEYGDVDISLDPFPFGGGLTGCEALWMGVPVVTLPGDRPASRQTLGFLRLLGLDDWAASSPTDYIERAASLAVDPHRLAVLRHSLRSRLASSPMCNGPLFTAALESAFREMWRRRCAGQRVAPFDVSPLPGGATEKPVPYLAGL